jgi:hypothetical protein
MRALAYILPILSYGNMYQFLRYAAVVSKARAVVLHNRDIEYVGSFADGDDRF